MKCRTSRRYRCYLPQGDYVAGSRPLDDGQDVVHLDTTPQNSRTAERDESGHRLRYQRHPLVHGDEEPGATNEHEQCIGHYYPAA